MPQYISRVYNSRASQSMPGLPSSVELSLVDTFSEPWIAAAGR